MKSLSRIALVCWLSLSHSSLAAITISETMQVFHEGIQRGKSLESILRQELKDHYSEADVVLTGAIGSTPADVADIVRIAIDEGVLVDDIAAQCDTMLNQQQLVNLIRVSLSERIDPAPIIKRCFAYIPKSQISDLLAHAINNSTPGQIERVLDAAFQALSNEVADPFALVKEGVLRSNAFTVEGIEYAEGVDDLITEIRLQDVLEVLVTEEGASIDEVADADLPPPSPFEPPFSDS